MEYKLMEMMNVSKPTETPIVTPTEVKK